MLDMYRKGGRAENGLWLRDTSEGTAVCGLADGFEPEELIIPEGAVRIMPRAFEGCGSIKKAVIADSVRAVGSRAFCKCTALETAELFAGLLFDETVFEDCTQMTELYVNDSDVWTNVPLIIKNSPDLHISEIMFLYSKPAPKKFAAYAAGLDVIKRVFFYDVMILVSLLQHKQVKVVHYLKSIADRDLAAAFTLNDPENTAKLLHRYRRRLKSEELDALIELAAKSRNCSSIYLVLIDHKNRINGYADGDRLKL